MAEFQCFKCGEINEIDLSQVDLAEELINQGIEESGEEIEKLEAKNKALELKLERTVKGLEVSQSGISKAISKTKDQSVEIQGEIAEELLQDRLEEAFSEDTFSPIKKGQRGADIKQVIFTNGGFEAGGILYESKSTKSWSNNWVEKLKSDLIEDGSDIGVLVSKAFPAKEKDLLVQIDERIWLCKPGPHVIGLVKALRDGILRQARQKNLETFKSKTPTDNLLDYVTGDLINQLQAMGQVYQDLNDEMIKEKNAFKTKWNRREKVLDSLAGSLTGVVGSIQGIGIESLSLDKIKQFTLEE
tara:strand:+ start:182 stop:1084 length:903 start_codon:yes stop_codon:yes gene_type:complete